MTGLKGHISERRSSESICSNAPFTKSSLSEISDICSRSNLRPVDVVNLWRQPGAAALVLVVSSLIYWHCMAANRTIVSLIADMLLVIVCAIGILRLLCRHLKISISTSPFEVQLSAEAATCFVACLANTVCATEGVLRVAASGSDYKLFAKVVTFLYGASILGRMFSGPTLAYIGLWLSVTVPFFPQRETMGNGGSKGVATCRKLKPGLGSLSAILRTQIVDKQQAR
eukprot:SM000039S14511  [mRNA]  locus=s39:473479:474798:+ [translate_table: standard]